MAVSIGGAAMFGADYNIPEITLENLHPEGLPVWPFMFVTVACGAVSGFHATQSPMIAKCITGEREGRKVFYGAMIIESVIALVWAAAYLLKNAKNKYGTLITAFPAAFMSAVSMTYILMADEGFRLPAAFAYPAGICFAAVLFIVFLAKLAKKGTVAAVSRKTI